MAAPTPIVSFNPLINSLNETENIANTAFKQCYETTQDILKYSSDKPGDFLKMKTCMTSLAESKRDLAVLARAAGEISNLAERTNFIGDDACERFGQILQESLEDEEIDENHKQIIDQIESFIDKNEESAAETEEDSELLVTKEMQSFKDPLTQKRMIDPVKSKICKHAFERSSIMEYISVKSKRCPYSGCQNVLRKEDLIDDLKLKYKILNLLKEGDDSS